MNLFIASRAGFMKASNLSTFNKELLMAKYMIQDRKAGWIAFDWTGKNKRDALNSYRQIHYPGRERLPVGVSIWEA